MDPSSNKSLWRGILFMISAWSLFAIMGAFAKHSYAHTTPPVTFFLQNFIGFLLLLPYFLRSKAGWLRSEQWGLIAIRGLFGASSFFLLLFSLSKIPLTHGTLLNNAAPLFVPFLAALFLKTQLRVSLFLSTGMGFLGVIFILKPTAGFLQIDALPAFISGFFSAIVMILMRLLSREDPKRVVFAYLAIASSLSAPFAIPQLSSIPSIAWPFLFCVGMLFACAQLCYTQAFRYAQPTTLAPFSYTCVTVSGLLDCLIWEQAPTLSSMIGILLIVCGGILTVLQAKTKEETGSTRRTERDSNP